MEPWQLRPRRAPVLVGYLLIVTVASTVASFIMLPVGWAVGLGAVLWLWALWTWRQQPETMTLEPSGWCCWRVGRVQHSAVARPAIILDPWLVVLRAGRRFFLLPSGSAPHPAILRQVIRWARLQEGGLGRGGSLR